MRPITGENMRIPIPVISISHKNCLVRGPGYEQIYGKGAGDRAYPMSVYKAALTVTITVLLAGMKQ